MSDSKLRELERRWLATRSPVEEAAFLLERVRVGDLGRDCLELAAFYGHQAATHSMSDVIDRPRAERSAWRLGIAGLVLAADVVREAHPQYESVLSSFRSEFWASVRQRDTSRVRLAIFQIFQSGQVPDGLLNALTTQVAAAFSGDIFESKRLALACMDYASQCNRVALVAALLSPAKSVEGGAAPPVG